MTRGVDTSTPAPRRPSYGTGAKVRNSSTAGRDSARHRSSKKERASRSARAKWERRVEAERDLETGEEVAEEGRVLVGARQDDRPSPRRGHRATACRSNRLTMARTSAASPGAVSSSTAPSRTAGPAGGANRRCAEADESRRGRGWARDRPRGVSLHGTEAIPSAAAQVAKDLGAGAEGRSRARDDAPGHGARKSGEELPLEGLELEVVGDHDDLRSHRTQRGASGRGARRIVAGSAKSPFDVALVDAP